MGGVLGLQGAAFGAYASAEVEAALAYARAVLNGYINLQNRDIQQAENVEYLASGDPNELEGPFGTGGARWVSGRQPLNYAVFFENEATASAPAHKVVVTTTLDPNADLSTVGLTGISVPGIQVPIPPTFVPAGGLNETTTNVDLRPSQNLLINIDAQLEPTNRVLTWTFTSIDATTGLPPSDPTVGFLAPGSAGSAFFTVRARQSLPTGTKISDQATVVFDSNPPISTQTWMNTLDNTPPVSHVSALPTTTSSTIFTVQWTGTDVGGGIQDYTVYVSDNGGAFITFRPSTSETSATYSGEAGHTYGFYSIARDLVGNVEGAKSAAEATTQVVQGVVDNIPPITTASISPLANPAGWNNSNVVVSLNSTDNAAGSGVKQITYLASGGQTVGSTTVGSSLASFTISTEGITTITFLATDNADNVESAKTLTVSIDKTPPNITGARAPALNASGWNNSAVTVSFQCADSLSGLAPGSPPTPTILGSQGPAQAVTGTCQDTAGNSASATASGINIDLTPPTLTSTASPPPNASGWNNTNVTVSFTAADALSGVGSVTSPVMVTTDGAGQAVTGSASDFAGNVTLAKVLLNIDKSPPAIGVSTPATGATYAANQVVNAAYACNDYLGSGVATCTGTVPTGSKIDTAPSGPSTAKTFSVNSTDVAGNPASQLVSYVVSCHYLALGISPSTVSRGSIATITGTVMSCKNAAQTVSVKFTLTGPLGPKSCATTSTEMFTSPQFTIAAGTSKTISFPFFIPKSACAGPFTITTTTLVAGTPVDSTSAILTVQ